MSDDVTQAGAAGHASADPAPRRPATAPIAGEISVFLDALGTREGSLEVLNVIGLVGPRYERHRTERGGVEWQYLVFGPNGADLQFREGVLVGALLWIAAPDGGGSYPRPEALFEGLPLPASRGEVVAALGAPTQAEVAHALYRLDDRYLDVEFADDRVVSLSVMLRGVGPA
ncbi:hypothetical protein [Microbacterium album]|uniref:Uncharacterized protein n=1 Tax=Microbacterium album TaxID=2053191 RepID=A0A917IGJ0_9MICO|nr:hypothetical protein [Microbacterium album]GGH47802.1 hypothetical protein GCM10010921_24790 [Microbacterium album]